MIHFIHPIDASTEFLKTIYFDLINVFGSHKVNVYAFTSDEEGEAYKSQITKLPENSSIIFLGHGRSDRLYGVLETSNESYFSPEEMKTFNKKNLFLLACQSCELLKKTFRSTNINHSIGFGHLPTSEEEVQKIKNMRKRGASERDIEIFKKIIVRSVSKSLISTFQNEKDFDYLNSHLRLLLHKEMNKAVLENKLSGVAKLIYQMCYQMSYYRS